MFTRALQQIRAKVRARDYLVTIHADEEMDNDKLTIFDVERVILTGSVIERQKDKNTAERKYLIKAEVYGEGVIVVCKLSITSKLVIITVYSE